MRMTKGQDAASKDGRPNGGSGPAIHKNHDIYLVPGLQRGLLVLEALANEGRPLTIAEIGRRIGLGRSSMFRLAYTLEHMGFVESAPDTKALRLAPRVLNIGYAYLASQTLIEIATPELEALRDRTNVSAHLAILDRREVLYLSCVQARSGFLSTLNVGARLPAYASPLGWALLSRRTAEEIAELFPERRFVPLTAQTPRTVRQLVERIEQVRAAGHAISHGVVDAGGSSIAAPVRNNTGAVVAAIDLSAPDSAFEMETFETSYTRQVMQTAHQISVRLGYVPDRTMAARARGRGSGRP